MGADMQDNAQGSLFIISAPSGTGKTSLVKQLVDSLDDIQVSVSHTTRPKRSGEVDGVSYHFIERQQFENMIAQSGFLEYAEVYEHYYGTSQAWVADTLQQGTDVVLEIEWQGAKQVQRYFPDAKTIFILPPDAKSLEQRLRDRGKDQESIIHQRLHAARNEVQYCVDYQYIVVNDEFDKALSDLQAIVRAERCRSKQQMTRYQSLIEAMTEA